MKDEFKFHPSAFILHPLFVTEDLMPILEAEGLVKIYGSRRVVDGVGFAVETAEIVGLLGPNGAGKTTSFRMTCGMIEPNEGHGELNGIDVTLWPKYRRGETEGQG